MEFKELWFQDIDDASEQAYVVDHAVWADNIILFARGYKEMQHVTNDLDAAFAVHKTRTGDRHFQ